MSKQFYDVSKGLQLDSGPVFLQGSGVPGSTTDTNSAAKGSYYLDVATGKSHTKITAGSGTDKWDAQASETFTLNNAGSQSWREATDVILTANYADIAAVKTDADADDDLDGVTVTVGMRVLPLDLTTGNENVYIVGGSTGAWTFTEDTNTADEGDRIVAKFGSEAGREYRHNGTIWVFVNQSNLDEQGFLRSFMGKTGPGAETPSYTSQVFITDGDTLEVAAGKLDAQVNTNDGDIATNAADILKARTQSASNNVTTITVLDSVDVNVVAAVKWTVYAMGNAEANAEKKFIASVLAGHNGHNVGAGDDATGADYNVASILKSGDITDLDFTVDVNGAGAGQVMRLNASSTMAADIRIVREVIEF